MYSYSHQSEQGPFKADVHDVYIKRSKLRLVFSYIGIFILMANLYCSFTTKNSTWISSSWSIFVGLLMTKVLKYKPIKKESVVIMPSFGVQLEVHFWSGRVDRRFVPIGEILRAVLNECVTPVTCYWSLALILRDEDELFLVFQKSRPPVKILVPIWKAMCKATDQNLVDATALVNG